MSIKGNYQIPNPIFCSQDLWVINYYQEIQYNHLKINHIQKSKKYIYLLNHSPYTDQKQVDIFYFYQKPNDLSMTSKLAYPNPIIYILYHSGLFRCLVKKHSFLHSIYILYNTKYNFLPYHSVYSHLKQLHKLHHHQKPIFMSIINILDFTNPNFCNLSQSEILNLILIKHIFLPINHILCSNSNKIRQKYPKFYNNRLPEYIIQSVQSMLDQRIFYIQDYPIQRKMYQYQLFFLKQVYKHLLLSDIQYNIRYIFHFFPTFCSYHQQVGILYLNRKTI